MDTRNFEVLYTHQKQKKNKTWQDGCLKVSCNGTKAVLYNDGKTSLEIFHIQPNKVFSGSDVECDRYLINIGDEQKVEAKGKHCLERSAIIAAGKDIKTREKHVHTVKTESFDSSLKKRKRQHFTTTGNFHHNDKIEKTMTGCKIFRENSHGGLANPRKSILEEPSWEIEKNTKEPKKDYPKDDYERVVPSSAPAQKRNKKELLSLFSHKPLIDPTLCEGMTTNWIALNQEEYCCKNLNSSNMPHKFQYQNTKESGWKINDGELHSPQISGYGQRAFSDHSKSNPPIEHSAYLDSNINIFEGLDCSLDDSGDFGDHTFFDMVKPTNSATNRKSSSAAIKCNSNVKLFFSDSQVVDTDDSVLETLDFESDVNDEILFDICPRFETSDTFSCETKQNIWTVSVETPSVHDVQTGNYVSGSNKGFLAKNIMERGPLNCGKRTPMSFKSHSFAPPVLPSVVPESHSLMRDKLLAPKDSTPAAMTSTQGCHSRLQLSFSGELYFPFKEHCSGSITPTREVAIPIKFGSVMEYKQILKSALREHLNIILFELAQTYHGILTKVDIASSSDPFSGQKENIKGPSCSHGLARLRAVKKDGPNKGRHFYCCPSSGSDQCKFFKWADECHKEFSTENKKLPLTSSDSIRVYFKSNGVHFYHDCLFERRIQMPYAKRYSGKKHSRGGQRHSDLNNHKKSMYVVLKYRESSSSYSKDDIWIVSKTLSFEPHSTFVAKSLFYGPSSSGDLEIEPVSGYSPSNWKSGDTVHAVWACNAGTELSCIKNMDDHVTSQQMPLLPYVLNGSQPSHSSSRAQRFTFTAPLTSSSDRNSLGVTWSVIEEETEKMVIKYKLNEDQTAAIYSCAKMFTSPVEGRECPAPITLIHGVFGAGKSFLLAVVVLLMVRLFEISDASDETRSSTNDWKILISSTTNVAVDRILVGLLDLGFDQFVRVGSLRKIAKPVLPFSIHSAGSESQELKELQTMLKSDLTTSEKAYVRKSIERQKLGENRKRLSNVRVVGVTCAACVFPSLERLKFPVLLLDECSQMTEPASLLPMARFGCRKLVLVGDPQQLNPTIQGSEPKHETGLEQTLFDRLIKMNFEPVLLRTQYRCHPRISSIANRLFYNGNLLNGVTLDERQPLVDFLPTLCFYNVSKGREQCSQDGSYFNQSEANFIVVLIKSLLESQVNPTQIGVITQYKSQLTTITNSLMSDGETSNKELKGVQISTVDAFQGGEKDVIILSCVRTQHVGFIDCKRRTNVAVTRAKRHLCIVGCGRMLSSNSLWGKIITYCQETPNGVQCSETFIRQWNEKRPALSEGSSNKSTREKQIKAKSRNTKVKPTEVTVQHESNSSKDPNVSIHHVRFQTEPKQTLMPGNNTINDDDEIQEIVPDADRVCSQDSTVVLIEDNNDGLPSEFEFFNSLMEDDLSDYSSFIDA